jgi:hypothetical protein
MGLKKLERAKNDLRYLLNQGYNKKSALKFIGDNLQLNLNERNYLTRKVFSTQKAINRIKKLTNPDDINNKIILIDGYNVLITLESVLYHEDSLVRGDDGVLRDLNAIFGKYKPHENTEKTISILIDFLNKKNPQKVHFLFDSPVSHSGELSKITELIIKNKGLNGVSKTSKTVDSVIIKLAGQLQAIVSSSDGIIIDKVDKVVDLPAAIYNELKKSKKNRI